MIYLIRHGQAAASWEQDPDPGLSPLGQQQAQSAAAELATNSATPIDSIYSSPMQRARATALPFAARTGQEILIDNAFREIPTPPGIPLEQRMQWLQGCARQSWREADSLLVQWRQQLIERLCSIGDQAVVYTHFMVMNAVLGYIQDEPGLVCYQPDYCSVLAIANREGVLHLVDVGRQLATPIL